MGNEPRVVDLQHVPCFDDLLILVVQRIRQGTQVVIVVGIVVVAVLELEIAGRKRRDESLDGIDRFQRGAQDREFVGELTLTGVRDRAPYRPCYGFPAAHARRLRAAPPTSLAPRHRRR